MIKLKKNKNKKGFNWNEINGRWNLKKKGKGKKGGLTQQINVETFIADFLSSMNLILTRLRVALMCPSRFEMSKGNPNDR